MHHKDIINFIDLQKLIHCRIFHLMELEKWFYICVLNAVAYLKNPNENVSFFSHSSSFIGFWKWNLCLRAFQRFKFSIGLGHQENGYIFLFSLYWKELWGKKCFFWPQEDRDSPCIYVFTIEIKIICYFFLICSIFMITIWIYIKCVFNDFIRYKWIIFV